MAEHTRAAADNTAGAIAQAPAAEVGQERMRGMTNVAAAEKAAMCDEQTQKNLDWAANMADADRTWQGHCARRAELLPRNKAALFEALATAGITCIVITFDGCGDSGQMEEVNAYGLDGQLEALPTQTVPFLEVGFEAIEPTKTMISVRETLESLAYELLDQTHDGWENDDGAYGEFKFDVPTQVITLEYNERYTGTHHHEHEF